MCRALVSTVGVINSALKAVTLLQACLMPWLHDAMNVSVNLKITDEIIQNPCLQSKRTGRLLNQEDSYNMSSDKFTDTQIIIFAALTYKCRFKLYLYRLCLDSFRVSHFAGIFRHVVII